jgi:hypothetical protein
MDEMPCRYEYILPQFAFDTSSSASATSSAEGHTKKEVEPHPEPAASGPGASASQTFAGFAHRLPTMLTRSLYPGLVKTTFASQQPGIAFLPFVIENIPFFDASDF